MGWEEDLKIRFPCPCGKGEYGKVHYSYDWGRSRVIYEMLCPKCREKYVYDDTAISHYKDHAVERGWVLRNILEEEFKLRGRVDESAKALYFKSWRRKFERLSTRKQIWQILTLNGKYCPSIGTFYKHIRGLEQQDIQEYTDRFFNYDDIKQVFEVKGTVPNQNLLDLNQEEIQCLRPEEERRTTLLHGRNSRNELQY